MFWFKSNYTFREGKAERTARGKSDKFTKKKIYIVKKWKTL